jgi:hypothetical protein
VPSGVNSVSEAEVAIIGAGPYGLAAAAHLRDAGVETRIFGETMEFWHKQMPVGMQLRSRKRSSHISNPDRSLMLDDFGNVPEHKLASLSLAEFLEYGHWFQTRVAPDLDPRKVSRVERASEGFRLVLEDGEQVDARRVVVAAGLFPFAYRPAPFDSLPSSVDSLVSHSSEHSDLSRFAGQDMLVVGRGQSALESAALLHESGASVEIVTRSPAINWLGPPPNGDGPDVPSRLIPPTDVGGRVTGWVAAIPDIWRHTPTRFRPEISFRCIRPAGAVWLIPRLADVPVTAKRLVSAVEATDGRALVRLDDGSELVADHVLLGTGYKIDVARYPFLAPELAESLDLVDGYPKLTRGLESSVPGLHFIGAPAALSFGPVMRFVAGTWYAAPALSRRIAGKRDLPLRRSF